MARARLAVIFTLIFSLFLFSHARLQLNQPENQVVEWKPSNSNGLPVLDSVSKSEILPSNHLTDSTIDPKILLPSEKPKEDAVLSEKLADSEATNALALPGSEAVTVLPQARLQPDQPENLVVEWNPSSSKGLPAISEKVAESEPTNAAELLGSHGITVADTTISSNNEYGFHFHSNCHHHEENKHKEEKEMEKQFEPRTAGEDNPYGDDMIMARTAGFLHGKRVHHHEPAGEGEGSMRFEEGKMKRHKKEWKKEKEDGEGSMRFEDGKMKRQKKEWKKEKEDDEGKMRFEEGKMKRNKEWKKEKKDGEGMMRLEEGKMKRHKEEWKKEKEDDEGMMRFKEGKMKRHKEEWKKEKEDDEGMMRFKEGKMKRQKEWKKKKEGTGLTKLFRKCLKKFFKLFR